MMMKFQEDNYSIFNGLYTTLSRTRDATQNAYYKTLTAQRHYYFSLSGINFTKEQEDVITLLDEALHKFYWGSLSLEQLWGLHHYLENPDRGLPVFLDVPITTGQNELIFLFGFLFDQTLFAWRSFLDYYLKYLLLFLTGKFVINMSVRDYKKGMEKHISHTDDKRCKEVHTYIQTKVLSKEFGYEYESWGDFLRSLRDKTTHQKIIKPTIVEKEISQGFNITWPNVRGKDLAEISQWEFGNKAFEMLIDLFPILYGFGWIPGPYKPGMYRK